MQNTFTFLSVFSTVESYTCSAFLFCSKTSYTQVASVVYFTIWICNYEAVAPKARLLLVWNPAQYWYWYVGWYLIRIKRLMLYCIWCVCWYLHIVCLWSSVNVGNLLYCFGNIDFWSVVPIKLIWIWIWY